MIKQLFPPEFHVAAEVIRMSFATVANDLGLTEQNCPKYVGFVTTAERLRTHYDWGWSLYGLCENERLIGYVSISKEDDNAYEIHNLAVLPEYRHRGYGKQLLDFCISKVVESGGSKVKISIIEENSVLKRWYETNGFAHTGTKKFEHLPFTSGYMELDFTFVKGFEKNNCLKTQKSPQMLGKSSICGFSGLFFKVVLPHAIKSRTVKNSFL